MGKDKILFRNFKSPLGPMIGGGTAAGVLLLEWHDRGGLERIKNRLIKRYKLPLEEGTNQHIDLLEAELEKYFQGKLKKFSVKIDVSGTKFQEQVWDQLHKIPYGQTCCYGDIAKALEKPGASRAVGAANGANYLGIVIPCHRVIQNDGALRGYGGKLWRKKYLLELEAGHKPEIPAQVLKLDL